MVFPTQAMRSATQRKILRVLAEKNKRYTVEELADMCQRSEGSISRALENADRYSFLQRDTIAGSKKLTARLDPDSPYTEPIREFFALERRQERANGTVPVQIWNLLEDIIVMAEREVDGLVDICLFGSYATGDYYAGSDIDLLVIHVAEKEETVYDTVQEVLESKVPEDQDVHPVLVAVPPETEEDELRQVIERRGPVEEMDVLMPLLGEVDLS